MAKNKLPVASANAIAPEASNDYKEKERQYKAEEALRDIERAEKHKQDKGLMKDVKKCAKMKMKALGKI